MQIISQARNVLSSLQPKDHWITELVADEYLGTSGDRVKIRNGFTQLIGDFLFTVPAIKTANAHNGRLMSWEVNPVFVGMVWDTISI